MWVWSVASLSGLGIWCCCDLWCRLQMRLRSHVAVAVVQVSSCSSNSTPSLVASIWCGCSPKKKKKRKDCSSSQRRERSFGQGYLVSTLLGRGSIWAQPRQRLKLMKIGYRGKWPINAWRQEIQGAPDESSHLNAKQWNTWVWFFGIW